MYVSHRALTLRRPCLDCACRAAMAALLNRQKPIGSLGVAWWPGGRQRLNPTGVSVALLLLAATTASTIASAAATALNASL